LTTPELKAKYIVTYLINNNYGNYTLSYLR